MPLLITPTANITHSNKLRGMYGHRVSKVIVGDGNCMFRAMSFHLYNTQDRHMTVRSKAVHYLRQHPETLNFDVDSNYLTIMEKEGTWGDEIMLQAIAAVYNISIFVYSASSSQQRYSVTYPHSAPGPHYGLFFFQAHQHYEVLF